MSVDYDVIVVGAGIHGCGVVQAVAAAGHSVCVLEQTAVAAGTSSRSSKLIHGGLRYLESGQLGLVQESLAERRRLMRIAPTLVQLLPMHIPVYRGMRRAPWQIHAGLTAYALLGGLGRDMRFSRLPRADWDTLDGLDTADLLAVFRYNEATCDDAALTRAVLESARALGAEARIGAEFIGAEVGDDGVEVGFREQRREQALRARVLVNAAGPWAPRVAAAIRPERPAPAVELVKGSHLEYDGAPALGAYYVEAPDDGRAVFVMRRNGRTLVGTTEHLYTGDPAAVAPDDDEIAYLHRTFTRHFPARAGEAPVAAWAGLRVLPVGASPVFGRRRDTVFDLDHARRPRVLSLYGGKLTTWRITAARALARIERSLPPARRLAATDAIKLG